MMVLLGIIGLVTLNIHRRVKEIGVRKVLGASRFSITFLFFREFLSINIFTFLVTTPMAFYISYIWLNNYAYKIQISALVFIIAMLVIVLITFFLVSVLTLKLASQNPTKSLRTE